MAGFWTGLVHGTLICGATLAALSLALPRDAGGERDSGAVAGRAQDAEALTPAADAAVREPVASNASAGGSAQDAEKTAAVEDGEPAASFPEPAEVVMPGPDAVAAGESASAGPTERLPDPIGSDFRRGSDDPPRIPEASPAPVGRHVPESVAASDEGSPPPVPNSGELPPVSAAPAAPGLQPPELFEPEPLVAPQDEAPMAIAVPGRAATPGLDRPPETGEPDSSAVALSNDSASADQESDPSPDNFPAAGSSNRPDGAAGSGLLATAPTLSEPPDADGPTAAADAIPDSEAAEAPPGFAGQTDDPSAAVEPQVVPDKPAPAAAAPANQPDTAPTISSPATRAPRPAPDLSIPRALFAPGTGRNAPGLPQPASATPPAPDLSDINPGVSR